MCIHAFTYAQVHAWLSHSCLILVCTCSSVRKRRSKNAAGLFARQTMFVHWRRAARGEKTTPKKWVRSGKRKKCLHVGVSLWMLLQTWPLDRHCAIIKRDCAGLTQEKERESESESSLIYGSEPAQAHTHTRAQFPCRDRCVTLCANLRAKREVEREGQTDSCWYAGILMVFNLTL